MDLEQIVAWWADKYLSGDMTGVRLVAALQELSDTGQTALSDSDSLRLSDLVQRTRQALGDDAEPGSMEVLLSEFLGASPPEVLESRRAPDWRL